MAAIIIRTSNNKNLKLLTTLAEQLGETANKLSPTQAEDLLLGMMMKKEKTGKTVNRGYYFQTSGRLMKVAFDKRLVKINNKVATQLKNYFSMW